MRLALNSDNPDLWSFLAAALASACAGLIGMVTGYKVHESELKHIHERLDRMEDKLDRLIERERP